jgi:hypothetical protein
MTAITRYILLSCFIVFVMGSCAQEKKLIKDSHAFYKRSSPGTQTKVVDMEGKESVRPNDTIHIIYLQSSTKKGMLVVDSAFLGQKTYKAKTEALPEDQYTVGITRGKNDTLHLKAAKDHTWWQVILIPVKANSLQPFTHQILLKAHLGNKPFQLKLSPEIELKPDIRM